MAEFARRIAARLAKGLLVLVAAFVVGVALAFGLHVAGLIDHPVQILAAVKETLGAVDWPYLLGLAVVLIVLPPIVVDLLDEAAGVAPRPWRRWRDR